MLLNVQTLVKLASSTNLGSENVRAGESFSLRDRVRRKRSELPLTIDGEGVHLYDISTAKLLTSYALSFEEQTTCAPTSVRVKEKDGSVSRYTYVSVASGKGKVHGWLERNGKEIKLAQKLQRFTWQNAPGNDAIVYLGVCGLPDEPDVSILLVHRDGTTRLLTSDLERELWVSIPSVKTEIVQSVFLPRLDQAKAGLLKNREDISTRLHAMSVADFLVMIKRGPHTDGKSSVTRLTGFAVHPGHQKNLYAARGGIEEVLSMDIPQREGLGLVDTTFHFHKISGSLTQHGYRTLAQYDLTGPSAELLSECTLEDNITSCIPLSSATVAISTTRSTMVLDTRYGSLKAVASSPHEEGESGDKEQESGTILLSYFSPLSTFVALGHQQLLSLQVHGHKRDSLSGGELTTHTLGPAIDRGLKAQTTNTDGHSSKMEGLGNLLTAKGATRQLKDTRKQLHAAAKENNHTLFDDTASKLLDLQDAEESVSSNSIRELTHAILSNMFRLTSAKGGKEMQRSLKVRVIPPKAINWLIAHGFFCQQVVEQSFKHAGKLGATSSLTSCAMVDAIHDFDSSLQTLRYLVSSPGATTLDATEIVRITHHALQVLQQAHILAAKVKLLTAAANVSGQDITETDANNVEAEDEEVCPGIDSDKVHDAHALIRYCLGRLIHCDAKKRQNALTTAITQSSLLSFIDYLRLELARGGWLTPYVVDDVPKSNSKETEAGDDDNTDSKADESENQPSDHSHSVAVLLSCAIDSLGAGAWLSTANVDNGMANTVSHMKAEISAALEGIEEATYLQGMLHEVLAYAKHNPLPPPGAPDTGRMRRGEKRTVTAADGTEMVKPIMVGSIGPDGNALPIGLKPIVANSLTREERENKTAREIGLMTSMKVGPYSFERIMI